MFNWLIWFHVISFMSWFAVLFYLPRLFVYHKENEDNEGFVEVVKVMEYKLYKYIGIPGMWATVLSGAFLVFDYYEKYGVNLFKTGGWLHAKLFFVVLLIIYFLSLNVIRKRLAQKTCKKSGIFFRYYNEVPTVLMLLIVGMVVFKP